MNYNNDFKYDLKVGQMKEKELGTIFQEKTIEVKHDRGMAYKTKNIFVEYESRGKKSGIATSKAEYYCFTIGETFHIIKTITLKERCRKYIGTSRDVCGGDSGSSKGILLPTKELF